jgi:long-subunit acyl-CoA synthetase (AMP-forming)
LLSNGLKVNPSHIETSLQSHPALKGSLVFRWDRTKCGILLEPKDLKVVRNALAEDIWPALESANKLVPEHARIDRDLIVAGNSKKPFLRASKGTILRSLTTNEYENEIEGVYCAAT